MSRKNEMSRITPDILKNHAKWFAANLKRLRKFRGLSQSDLATAVGVEVGTVQSWERGAEYTTPVGAERLCTVLKCQEAHLYNPYYGHPFMVAREPDAIEKLTYTEAAVRAKSLILVSEDEWNALYSPTGALAVTVKDILKRLRAVNEAFRTHNPAAELDALNSEVRMLRGRLESINALSGK